jgi:SAM-dependent methyltransferase
MRPPDGTPVGLRNRSALGVPTRAVNAWNARHPWSHNDHFHGWILRNLPERHRRALDVGCGRGALAAKLASRFEEVTAIDPDAAMAGATAGRAVPNLVVRQQSLLDTEGEYDTVIAIASLHHLPIEDALTRVRDLVAPGGRLLVVGLTRLDSPADIAFDSASLLLNPVVGFVKHPRPVRTGPRRPDVPVRDPDHTYAELGAVARRVLPGVQVRRRLFFRYTLRWDGP